MRLLLHMRLPEALQGVNVERWRCVFLDIAGRLLYNKAYMGVPMDAITYSAARANLATTMDRVCEDHEALIITRNGQQSVVMVSLEDFTALEETAYLLRSPANMKRLVAAMDQLSSGKGMERKLAE
jgi:antitoxin YefM